MGRPSSHRELPRFNIRRGSSNQAISSGSTTTAVFNTDSESPINTTTNLSTGEVTILVSGLYLLTTQIWWAGEASTTSGGSYRLSRMKIDTGGGYVDLSVASTIMGVQANTVGNSALDTTSNHVYLADLAVGDKLRVDLLQNSGETLNIINSTRTKFAGTMLPGKVR